jgi:hypothetical protein
MILIKAFLLISACHLVFGFPTGAPDYQCKTMVPMHNGGHEVTDEPAPFSIDIKRYHNSSSEYTSISFYHQIFIFDINY